MSSPEESTSYAKEQFLVYQTGGEQLKIAEGELPAANVKEFLTVRSKGNRRVSSTLEHYNFGAIISVGYRIATLNKRSQEIVSGIFKS